MVIFYLIGTSFLWLFLLFLITGTFYGIFNLVNNRIKGDD